MSGKRPGVKNEERSRSCSRSATPVSSTKQTSSATNIAASCELEYMIFLIAAHDEELSLRRGQAEWGEGLVEGYAGQISTLVSGTWGAGVVAMDEKAKEDSRVREEEQAEAAREGVAAEEAATAAFVAVSTRGAPGEGEDEDEDEFTPARVARQLPASFAELTARAFGANDEVYEVQDMLESERDDTTETVALACAAADEAASSSLQGLPFSADDPGVVLDNMGQPSWWTLDKMKGALANTELDFEGFTDEVAGLIKSSGERGWGLEMMGERVSELERERELLVGVAEEERREVEEMRILVDGLREKIEEVLAGTQKSSGEDKDKAMDEGAEDVQIDERLAALALEDLQPSIAELIAGEIAKLSPLLDALKGEVAMRAHERKKALYAEVWGMLEMPMRVGVGVGRWADEVKG